MTELIFGVDLSKTVTPIIVRDAIVECFWEAHCAMVGGGGEEEITDLYCTELVKKSFKTTGGDFQNPTKEHILAVLEELKKFSASFRDQKTIEGHQQEIMKIIKKMG